jgi:polar amino acid transport system substrate-binding protein
MKMRFFLRLAKLSMLAMVMVTTCVGMMSGARAADPVSIPNFWDPRIRLERPDTSTLRVIRFLTDDEYPPLHFADPDGGLTGFSVELARAACERLAVACTIQARRFDTLVDSLGEGRGDVLAAAIPVTSELRKRFSAGQIYHRQPARFVSLRMQAMPEVDPALLKGKRVAVIAGSAHAAFVGKNFPLADRREVADLAATLRALRAGEADHVFADGLALALTLGGRNGTDLAFSGGPYLESSYFGEGVGFLVRNEDAVLRRALDFALQTLWDDGTYARLWLRYFPVNPY